MTGIDFDYSDQKALVTRLEARTDEYERRRQRGGLSFLGAFQAAATKTNDGRVRSNHADVHQLGIIGCTRQRH